MRLVLGLLIGVLASSSAHAEEMVPLDSIMQGNPEESYKFIRCAAFYKANADWAGEAVDQADVDQQMKAVVALLVVGTDIRSKKTGENFESVFEVVQQDATAMLQLYGENYRQSYALRGAAWDGNPLWESDAATCKILGEVALNITAGME